MGCHRLLNPLMMTRSWVISPEVAEMTTTLANPILELPLVLGF